MDTGAVFVLQFNKVVSKRLNVDFYDIDTIPEIYCIPSITV